MSSWWRNKLWGETLVALLACLGVVFLLYAGSFSHPWLHDDVPVVLENPDIRSFEAFLADRYPGRPLREMTYLLDYRLFGLNPPGWHVQNIFWHGLGGWLLFLLLRRLHASLLVAAGAALLFLVHPLQVEVVANIANRKDSLALCFALTSLLAWLRARLGETKSWPWFLASAGAFSFALMAKEHAVIVPLIILSWEILLVPADRRWSWLDWRVLAGMLGVGIGSFCLWFLFFGGATWFAGMIPYRLASLNIDSSSLRDYFLAVFAGWGELFRRVVFPLDLAPEYVYSLPAHWLEFRVLAPVLLAAGLVAVLVALHRQTPLMAFAIVWLLLFCLPVSNLLPLAYFVADRYMYTPLVGVALAMALLLERLPDIRGRWVVLVVIVSLLSGLTWQQNRIWGSARALWSHALEVSPASVSAMINLGDALVQEGQQDAAAALFLRAITINSAAPYPFYNLGVIYDHQGKQELALQYFRQFLLRADQSPVNDHHVTAKKLRSYLSKKYGIVSL